MKAWHLAAQAAMCGQQEGEQGRQRAPGKPACNQTALWLLQGKKLKKFIIFCSCSVNTHWRVMIKPCICCSPSPSRKRQGWLLRRSQGMGSPRAGEGPGGLAGDRDGAAGPAGARTGTAESSAAETGREKAQICSEKDAGGDEVLKGEPGKESRLSLSSAAGTEAAEDTGPCLMAEPWQPGARPRWGLRAPRPRWGSGAGRLTPSELGALSLESRGKQETQERRNRGKGRKDCCVKRCRKKRKKKKS